MRTPLAGSPRVPAQGQSAQGEPAPKVRAKAVADGNQVNIPGPVVRDERRVLSSLIGLGGQRRRSGKERPRSTVPETDTGGQVEHTKALERTVLKELGNLHP